MSDRAPVARWNVDKPHRCPECHTVAVAGRYIPRWWRRYRCCQCETTFARFPRLWRLTVPARNTCWCFESLHGTDGTERVRLPMRRRTWADVRYAWRMWRSHRGSQT